MNSTSVQEAVLEQPYVLRLRVTLSVLQTLTTEQVYEAFVQLRREMENEDPENPGFWTLYVAGYKLWAILDRGAKNQEVLTLLFPRDYRGGTAHE